MDHFKIINKELVDYPQARAFLQTELLKEKKRSADCQRRLSIDHMSHQLNQIWNDNPDKIKILFVVYYPLPNVIRQSLALRKTGRYVTALIGICVREEIRLEQFFDLHFECNNTYMLAELLACVKPDLIQAVAGPSMIPCLSILFSQVPVIIEVYDSLIFLWENLNDRADYQMENFSMLHANGVLHKYARTGHFRLLEYYKIDVPFLQFHTFTTREFSNNHKKRKVDLSEPKIVFTGGLMPPQRAIELGHTCLLFEDMIKTVTGQGIYLTIYANQNAKDMRWHRQKDYFDIQEHNSYFFVRSGIPVDRIGMIGHKYHFGLFYDKLQGLAYNPDHYKVATATKFFSYIEMGLPILIYPEFKFIYNLVEHYKIGLEYDVHNLSNMKQIVQGSKYQQLQLNVAAFMKTADINNYLSKLEYFHQKVLRGNGYDGEFDYFFPLE